ncbi:DUF333 domain-containing protein [Vibrio tarriae]|uniref:putative hemolysin n=1 Tax=Vibrio tarriae TaxID=2014742 RepID=UPI000DE1FE81|nr:DUF333 domain-containing protein [Vibrio tarriae]QEO46742.1 DUF333 domain-containing protein [Vibrio cholerae]RBM26017.1 DUF333 domain-containing protein [Vibrio tarriae]RBM26857.1 DUF333 domain-containing protein [Vibrio tarriae]RBM34036.1 DUF333 domain-containing protein [Vibrio tarriae]RBM36344.1 DUF333 domain-containing protein [Vibrio tarriae]
MNKTTLLLASVAGATLLAGCARQENEYTVKEYVSMANPAAVFCVKQGGELETVTENDQRITYCVTKDGEKVEQWEYFRQNHDQQ